MFVKIRKYKLKGKLFFINIKNMTYFLEIVYYYLKKKKTISLNKLNKENYEIFSNTSKVAIKYRKMR